MSMIIPLIPIIICHKVTENNTAETYFGRCKKYVMNLFAQK